MSTRSVLAYYTNGKHKGWKGVYCHWDGYPTNRGKQIWDIVQKDFLKNKGKLGVMNSGDAKNAVKAFIKIYIKGHPAGFSSFPEVCYCHDPSYVMRDGINKEFFTDKNIEGTWVEWAYVINPEGVNMAIYSLPYKKPPKPVALVSFLGDEPDWEEIESKG